MVEKGQIWCNVRQIAKAKIRDVSHLFCGGLYDLEGFRPAMGGLTDIRQRNEIDGSGPLKAQGGENRNLHIVRAPTHHLMFNARRVPRSAAETASVPESQRLRSMLSSELHSTLPILRGVDRQAAEPKKES